MYSSLFQFKQNTPLTPPVKKTMHEYVEVGGCHHAPKITDDGEAKTFASNVFDF